MNIKYCLPIIKETKEEVLNLIIQNSDYDFYEIWLSYIKDLDTDFAWKISEQFNGKLIFLFRKQNLEKTDLEKDLKEKIIRLLENSDNLLDLDIKDQKEELNFIKENNLSNKIIISYHNYKQSLPAGAGKETPDLYDIVQEMEKYKPEIYKVSTFCKTPEDSIKLLTLLLQFKKQRKKFIVLGMGEEGKVVRVIGALWGNEMNFTPASESENSAPGQLTKEKLEKILGILK